MASDKYDVDDFPTEKFGEWIPIDADTHFMPLEFVCMSTDDPTQVTHVRGVIQVETEQGSVGLVSTHVGMALVMHWLETEDDE